MKIYAISILLLLVSCNRNPKQQKANPPVTQIEQNDSKETNKSEDYIIPKISHNATIDGYINLEINAIESNFDGTFNFVWGSENNSKRPHLKFGFWGGKVKGTHSIPTQDFTNIQVYVSVNGDGESKYGTYLIGNLQ